MAAVTSRIVIRQWGPQDSEKALNPKPLNPKVYKHADFGTANYIPEREEERCFGLEEKRRRYEQIQTRLALGDKIYQVLFSIVDNTITTHSECDRFVFYLNDISSRGLDLAVDSLISHLRQNPPNRAIKIKIIKIAENFFKFNPMPRVNSASMIAVEHCPFAGIASLAGENVFSWQANHSYSEMELAKKNLHRELRWQNPALSNDAKNFLDLFQRIATVSQEGLWVREIDMCYGTAQAIKERLSDGITMGDLTFSRADEQMKSFAPYQAVDGRVFPNESTTLGIVHYAVTPAKKVEAE